MPNTKHIVGFSGGIDSQATARWVLNRYPAEDVILLNSDAGGNEHPLTTAHIEHYSTTIHPVVTVSAIVADMWEDGSDRPEFYGLDPQSRLTFDMMIARKGPPSRRARFCTEVLKLRPQRRWILEHFDGIVNGKKTSIPGRYEEQEREIYTGLRRDESDNRKNTPDREWDDYFDCWLNHPVAAWTKQQCFEYVGTEPINPLYRLGFNRVGCAPCILSTKEDILNWIVRAPEIIEKIRHWEKTVVLPGRTEPGFNWFQPIVPGCQKIGNNIDQVIEWAQTSRGGRQSLLPIMHDRPACESKYGLCE